MWADYVARGRAGSGAARQPPDQAAAPAKAFRGRVLGIDPSLRGTGLAVLEAAGGERFRLVATRTLKLKRSFGMSECLGAIAAGIVEWLEEHEPDHVAVEQTIYVQNLQTAQILGAARGAAIASVAMRGFAVFEYAPLRVKQAVVGAGRASKYQVAGSVRAITGADARLPHDESDAAAVALCHAFTWRFSAKTDSGAKSGQG